MTQTSMGAERGAARRGERWGWLLGWLGGFVWVALAAGICAWQGRYLAAMLGGLIVLGAIAGIFFCAPWRFPHTLMRWLMLPIYVLFGLSLLWAGWAFQGDFAMNFNAWLLLALIPALMPLWTTGRRRWSDLSKTAPKTAPKTTAEAQP